MTERSRRRVLAGSLGVAAALAGCGSFADVTGESGDSGEQYYRLAVDQGPTRPFGSPLPIPSSMLQSHVDRVDSILDTVPTAPEVPNEVIRDNISARRDQLVSRLEEVRSPGPSERTATANDGAADSVQTGEADEDADETRSPQRQLAELRELRRAAAELRGTYRAATGRYEEGELVARRDRLRTRLAEFRTGWEYRAADPMTAVTVHAEFEHDVSRVEHELTPWPQVPDRPADEPERVGYLAGKNEAAAALLADLRTFQERAVPSTGPTYRPALMATAKWLGRRARRAGIDLEDAPRQGRDSLDRDLGEGPTGALFDAAVKAYDNHSERNAPEGPAPGNYAVAVIRAATQRTAVTAAARTVAAIEDGLTIEDLSVALVKRRRSEARATLQTALDSGPTAFTARTLEPAYRTLRDANDALQSGSGAAAVGRFEFCRRVCVQVPEVIEETRFLLSEAAD